MNYKTFCQEVTAYNNTLIKKNGGVVVVDTAKARSIGDRLKALGVPYVCEVAPADQINAAMNGTPYKYPTVQGVEVFGHAFIVTMKDIMKA